MSDDSAIVADSSAVTNSATTTNASGDPGDMPSFLRRKRNPLLASVPTVMPDAPSEEVEKIRLAAEARAAERKLVMPGRQKLEAITTDLARVIREIADAEEGYARAQRPNYIEAGRLLTEAKAALKAAKGSGHWIDYLNRHGLHERRAQMWMRLYEHRHEYETVSYLEFGLKAATQAISKSRTSPPKKSLSPEEVRAQQQREREAELERLRSEERTAARGRIDAWDALKSAWDSAGTSMQKRLLEDYAGEVVADGVQGFLAAWDILSAEERAEFWRQRREQIEAARPQFKRGPKPKASRSTAEVSTT
jgi:hypothetical protein